MTETAASAAGRGADDAGLVEAVLARRAGAFEKLVEANQRLVWHLVYRMVQHPEDTRELCQEVFLRVHRQLHAFRFESRLSTWIGRIAFNIAARHLQRKRLPIVEPDDEGDAPAERVADDFDLAAACADDALIAELHDALAMLSPMLRTALTLFYLEELGVAEVAAIMEKPEGTIKNALFRGRAALREILEKRLGDSR